MSTPPTESRDLTECDREPITRVERIQSFGFLLALAKDWTVVRASANLEQFLGVRAQDAIGKPADDLLDAEALHDIRNRMLALFFTHGTERLFRVTLKKGYPSFDLSVYQSDPFFVFEAEPSGETGPIDAGLMVRGALTRLETQPSLEKFHREATRQVRAMIGFERAMIYRFDDDGAGEVIAESLSQGMESYLGLHYPASDIPHQARALYLRNPFRIIADVAAPTVELYPPTSSPERVVDLTLSITRAVSLVHIEYLRNMHVAASLSISIIVDGRLWGLIACHQTTARRPDFVARTAAEFFGRVYSLSLAARLRNLADEEERRLREATQRLIQAVVGDNALISRAEWLQDEIQSIIPCSGTVIMVRGRTVKSGMVPTEADLAALLSRLQTSAPDQVIDSSHFAAFLQSGEPYEGRPAGFLAVPLSGAADFLLLFRGEHIRDIRWAGNPDKAYATGTNERISPRKSFAAFLEAVRDRSAPFTSREKRSAEVIRAAIIEVKLRVSENVDEARKRLLDRQETLIAELNHRLRNVFGLMRALVNQTQLDALDVKEYASALNGRVQALAKAHDRLTGKSGTTAPLIALFEDEINAYVPLHRDRFTVFGPEIMLKPLAFSALALVIHELVTNSIKYGALSAHGLVHVDVSHSPNEGMHLRWRESDGPAVTPPSRRGFGSVVIERIVPFDLQGRAEVHYHPAGFEAVFFVPSEYVMLAVGAPAELQTAPRGGAAALLQATPLQGKSALLLEDNLIAALEAEDMLRAFGATAVWSVATIEAAREILAVHTPGFAMLDIQVGGGDSFGLAAQLRTLEVPFLFASGYGEDLNGTEKVVAPIITKPYERSQLCATITQALVS